MKYKAVIFDLFGTIVDNLSFDEYCSVLADMARILDAPPDDFTQIWIDTFDQRMVGDLECPDGNIEFACRKLGVDLNSARIKKASKIRFEYAFSGLKPRQGAIETIARIRSDGYKTGLISNCSTEVPNLWADTEFAPLFDTTVFSCSEKVAKPNSRIYEVALDKLEVEADDCLYIGDGAGDELSGAAETGMHPILIRVPYEEQNPYQIDANDWGGIKIASVEEVLDLLS